MESLLRTKVSEFCVQDALRLSEIEERVQKAAGQTPSEAPAEAPADSSAEAAAILGTVDESQITGNTTTEGQ